jgi:predicted phosphodiesterase
MAIHHLPKDFITVAGQHDLPQHNMDLFYKSGMNTLLQAGAISWIKDGGNFGQNVGIAFQTNGKSITVGVLHRFVWDGKNWPWPECEEITARKLLRGNPDFDLIVTGDYHKPFTYEYKGRLLVNCGCLTRQTADYADHRPRVWLWDARTNSVTPHYLVLEKGVVNRDHIEIDKAKEQRIDAFISRLTDEWEVSISFEENLKRFISSNQIRKSVVDLIYKSMNHE